MFKRGKDALTSLCHSSFAIILMGKREQRAGYFTLTVFLISCDSQWSVALPSWYYVCYCRISWPRGYKT